MADDLISLHGLEVFAHHGVLAEERQIGQRFVIDIDLALDLSRAGTSDALEETVDYGILADKVGQVVAGERWNLIERVAQRVADTVLALELVAGVTVTVHKPEAPLRTQFEDVSVTITRRRDG